MKTMPFNNLLLAAGLFAFIEKSAASPQPTFGNNSLSTAIKGEASVQAQAAVEATMVLPPGRPPVPPYPWRTFDLATNCICGPGWKDYYFPEVYNQWQSRGRRQPLAPGWFEIAGTVVEVQPRVLRIRGYSSYWPDPSETHEFVVRNFPFALEDNSQIGIQAVKQAGVYTYATVAGSSRTLRLFDFGEICAPPAPPPPTQEQLLEAKDRAARKKAEAAANAMRFNQELADRGDAYGELRMGERYRDGDGVPKDLQRAREWFSKAAAQGDKAAAKDLADLDQQ
jgi:hypothetical protein